MKVAYDQVRPHVTNDLHRSVIRTANSMPHLDSDTDVAETRPSLPQESITSVETRSSKDDKSCVTDTNHPIQDDEEIKVVAHINAKKRKVGYIYTHKEIQHNNLSATISAQINGVSTVFQELSNI